MKIGFSGQRKGKTVFEKRLQTILEQIKFYQENYPYVERIYDTAYNMLVAEADRIVTLYVNRV